MEKLQEHSSNGTRFNRLSALHETPKLPPQLLESLVGFATAITALQFLSHRTLDLCVVSSLIPTCICVHSRCAPRVLSSGKIHGGEETIWHHVTIRYKWG
jgi:hypothetical protein